MFTHQNRNSRYGEGPPGSSKSFLDRFNAVSKHRTRLRLYKPKERKTKEGENGKIIKRKVSLEIPNSDQFDSYKCHLGNHREIEHCLALIDMGASREVNSRTSTNLDLSKLLGRKSSYENREIYKQKNSKRYLNNALSL